MDSLHWIRVEHDRLLVRNVMLAEPLVGDFGRCFEGVTPDEAERLAASFALRDRTRREALVETLRTHLTTKR